MAHDLQIEVEKSFGLVKEKVTRMLEITGKAVREQDNQLKKIKSNLAKIETYRKELNSRLDSLESPFGRIPADLPDLIKFFPLFIITLIVVVMTSMRKS